MTVEITETMVRTPRREFSASIPASELLLFCRDLRGTVSAVVVAATGRALSTLSEVGSTLTAVGDGVGVAVDTDDGVRVPVVRNAAAARLPSVRAEVSRLVEAARAGLLLPTDVGGAVVTVYDFEPRAGVKTLEAHPRYVLAVLQPESGTLDITLSVTADGSDVAAEEASRLFARLVRLLQHPYRRLV